MHNTEEATHLERVLLARACIGNESERIGSAQEMISLIYSAGGRVVAEVSQKRESPDNRLFFGKGKISELKAIAESGMISTVVFDHNLTPGQVSRLEETTNCKVIDRTELIMAIFAGQARSKEAKLQIELAQLKYALPRLTGLWHHFSRLGAGIGTRGPGETQLEIDRRRARSRISLLERKISEIESRWKVVSARRQGLFSITIIGYTNSGKSTLLNSLCSSCIYTADKPFATLDTVSRSLELPDGSNVLISDTVGFIERLPETLVASFHTTLDVARKADLLLVAVDRASPYRDRHIEVVRKTLDRIEVNASIPRLTVWTKCDAVQDYREPRTGVAVSAQENYGLDSLLQKIISYRDRSLDWFELILEYHHNAIMYWLYSNCIVRNVNEEDNGSVRVLAGALRGYDSVVGKLEGTGLLQSFSRLAEPTENALKDKD